MDGRYPLVEFASHSTILNLFHNRVLSENQNSGEKQISNEMRRSQAEGVDQHGIINAIQVADLTGLWMDEK